MGICHSSIGGVTMIMDYDGVYLNENNISVVEPSQVLSPNGDHFVIKFIVFQECYTGKTKFDTEKECRAKIDQLFGCGPEKEPESSPTFKRFSDYSKNKGVLKDWDKDTDKYATECQDNYDWDVYDEET